MRIALVCSILAAGVLASEPVLAHRPSGRECTEASEFIRNAALARDNGTSRREFVERLEADLLVIRAFPAELRWFVQDDDDERFLRAAVARVFDTTLGPAALEAEFRERCADYARLATN